MATASAPRQPAGNEPTTRQREGRRSARKRPHLKAVPEQRSLRHRIRDRCRQLATQLDKASPLGRDEMEELARGVLGEFDLPERYVGWTMVMLASAFWHDQVAAVPTHRRLFLLPHCLKTAESCPGDYDEYGLNCGTCRACSIADFREVAEQLGYRVLVAEGSPIVMKIIVSGHVDALVGVACLNVLERALDKILLAGIPCMAVPLLSSNCRNTSVDEDWVVEMLQAETQQTVATTSTYVHLLRGAAKLFASEELEQLAPRRRGQSHLSDSSSDPIEHLDPVAGTEAIAYDFLIRGGKYSRPFITLAVYDALTGGHGTLADGQQHVESMPDSVRATALSIECFHKASLIHDDIEDDDPFRYGQETLHRRYGVPTAINVGDYLIGMGYRLVTSQAPELPADVIADLLHCLATAHTRLSEGQGAELLWRDAKDKRLTPLDALKIYALKTAPAFEAALYCGARLAGPVDGLMEPLHLFARHLGVAFQVLNDLKDWQGDGDNKLGQGSDVLGGRPTVLWALAIEGLDEERQQELVQLLESPQTGPRQRLEKVGQLYREADVFRQADSLVEKYQQRAEAVADTVESDSLRRLLYYLVDTVLDRPGEGEATEIVPHVVSVLPPP